MSGRDNICWMGWGNFSEWVWQHEWVGQHEWMGNLNESVGPLEWVGQHLLLVLAG